MISVSTQRSEKVDDFLRKRVVELLEKLQIKLKPKQWNTVQ